MMEGEFKELADPLLKRIYKKKNGGCCLHALLDDGNFDCTYDDEDLKHKDCREIYRLIRQLNEYDLNRLSHDCVGFYFEEGHSCNCEYCGRCN